MVYGDFKIGHVKLSEFIGKQPRNVESTAATQNTQMVNKEKVNIFREKKTVQTQ